MASHRSPRTRGAISAKDANTTDTATASRVVSAETTMTGFGRSEFLAENASAVPATISAFVLSTEPARVATLARCWSSLSMCQ